MLSDRSFRNEEFSETNLVPHIHYKRSNTSMVGILTGSTLADKIFARNLLGQATTGLVDLNFKALGDLMNYKYMSAFLMLGSWFVGSWLIGYLRRNSSLLRLSVSSSFLLCSCLSCEDDLF